MWSKCRSVEINTEETEGTERETKEKPHLFAQTRSTKQKWPILVATRVATFASNTTIPGFPKEVRRSSYSKRLACKPRRQVSEEAYGFLPVCLTNASSWRLAKAECANCLGSLGDF